MNFIIGYQLLPDGAFTKAILARHERVQEVYFSWGDMPNGRGAFTRRDDMQPFEAQSRLVAGLAAFANAGIRLNLLLTRLPRFGVEINYFRGCWPRK
jgi:hypothetical protein